MRKAKKSNIKVKVNLPENMEQFQEIMCESVVTALRNQYGEGAIKYLTKALQNDTTSIKQA